MERIFIRVQVQCNATLAQVIEAANPLRLALGVRQSRAQQCRKEADNRKQVEIGTLAPIEVVNAQAQVATANQNLIVSRTNLQFQQVLLKNALTRNGSDPVLIAADVVPTDRMQLPAAEPVTPIQDLINEAMQQRPELGQNIGG